LNRIGDALVTTPLISTVKNHSNCKIHILADRKNHFVFSNNPDIEFVHIFKKGLPAFLEFRNLVKSEKFDAVIDMHDDVSTTVSFLVALCGLPHRFALKKNNYKIYTNTAPKLDSKKYHVIDRIMVLSDLLNVPYSSDGINVVYNPRQQSIAEIENFLLEKYAAINYLVGINISAGSDARFWGIDRFKSVLSMLANFNLSIIIISAEKDLNFANQIADNKFPIFCDPDFDKFAALISKLNFLFTPDTSVVHLASAYNVPLFGLYVKYKTDDVIWSPYKSLFDCVITEEPNFDNLSFEKFKDKFYMFFERQYLNKNS
jgi:ADP-heptose:LPS heptosyltransferase